MAASDQRDEVIIKLKARIRELKAENAALKEYKVRYGKVIGNNLTRIAELKDNNAQLREALGAAVMKVRPKKDYAKLGLWVLVPVFVGIFVVGLIDTVNFIKGLF